MDLTLNAADLAFVLCGLIVALDTLLIWAIRAADPVGLSAPASDQEKP